MKKIKRNILRPHESGGTEVADKEPERVGVEGGDAGRLAGIYRFIPGSMPNLVQPGRMSELKELSTEEYNIPGRIYLAIDLPVPHKTPATDKQHIDNLSAKLAIYGCLMSMVGKIIYVAIEPDPEP
jgi:hypothetical protein